MRHIEMKLKKSIWALTSLAFAVFTSGIFSLIPTTVQAADALPWQTPAGTEGDFNNINFLSRIRFDSPVRITDTSNNIVYAADSTIFGNQNEDYLNNGGDDNAWYIYSPVGTDGATPVYSENGRCFGAYMLELDKDGVNAWLRALQPILGQDGATCVFDNSTKAVRAGRVQGDVNNRDEIVELGSWEDGTIDGDSENFRNVGAPFFWRSKDVIGAFDSSGDGLTELTSPQLDTARNIWTTASMGSVPSLSIRQQEGWRYFGSSNCASGFLAVDPENEFIYPVRMTIPNPGASKITDGPWDQCIWGRDMNGSDTGDSTALFDLPSYRYVLAFRQNATLSADQVDDTLFSGTGSTADPAAGETAVSCNNMSNSAIGWIICPVLDILDNMTERMTEAIQGFLVVDMDQFATNTELYQAWNVIRQISTVIIVIIALVMIFSEAMGAGFMDNYSVKKLLPRLILAGIGIQLSWVLLRLLIEVTNALGNGIGGILMSPFNLTMTDHIKNVIENSGGAGAGLFSGGFTGSGGSQGVLFGALVIGGAALLGIGSIFGLAIGVVAAVIIGFITLILRNIVIYLGMVLAPIGMAMSVLPGTQKMSKLWWESFEKALIMFPLIMGLLASGRIVSKLILDGAQGGFEIVAGIVAWYAPFFLLPATLKLGGTVLSKVSGVASNANKGFFDRAKKWDDNRQSVLKKNREASRNIRLGKDTIGAKLMRPLDRIGTGSVGGIRKGSRQAFRNLNVDNIVAGRKEEAQRKAREEYAANNDGRNINIDQATVEAEKILMQGRLYDRDLALKQVKNEEAKTAASRADLRLQEAEVTGSFTYVDRNGSQQTITNFKYSDKNQLYTIVTNSNDKAQVQAALGRMTQLGQDDVMRNVQASYVDPAKPLENLKFSDGTSLQSLYGEYRLGGEFAGAFKDKAPDLIKGAENSFDDIKSDAMVNWTDGTMRVAIQTLANKRAAAVASGNAADIAKANAAWERFGQSVEQIVNDPKLSGRMGNATLAMINNNNAVISSELTATGSASRATYMGAIGRITGSGTIV